LETIFKTFYFRHRYHIVYAINSYFIIYFYDSMSESLNRKTICLTMIVKNESHLIENTLKNIYSYIPFDTYAISDTGSTDSTKDIIKAFFDEKGVSGEIYDDEWVDFGHNRTLAFRHAYQKADYAFVWDADDRIHGDFKLPTTLDADHYLFTFQNITITWIRSQLFNNHKRWKYVGVLHEYPECEEPVSKKVVVAGNYHFKGNREGARSQDPQKYVKDATILEKAFYKAIETNDHLKNRYAFYCAQSYRDANMPEKAIEFYKKVIELKDSWVQEKYNACIELFVLLENDKKTDEGIPYLIESYRYDKTRVEGIYRLIKHYVIKGLPEVALAFYGLIQDWYENKYDPVTLSSRLFAKVPEYDFYLPYYMIIVADRLKQRSLGIRMYQKIFDRGHIPGQWWIQNLIHNLQFFIADLPTDNTEFCYKMMNYVDNLSLNQEHRVIIERAIHHFRPSLGAPSTIVLNKVVRNPIRIMLTMTTCKRLDLFKQTVNSILRTWTDLDQVDLFFCVDDNSSESDRDIMRSRFPFFEYYMKGPTEKGHRESMNIIWKKLKDVNPEYWIHLEDDWLFFKREAYVVRSMKALTTYEHQNVHQILFNRNYAELYATHGWDIGGGQILDRDTLLHVKDMKIEGRNCSYWPHYSFRPSIIRASKILELGNYNSPNTFFEQEYANRWNSKGFKSAFFNTICSLHIGKLTSDKSGRNAYTLNDISQFGGVKPSTNTFVVNLKRRPDRKLAVQTLFKQHELNNYEFFEAVDGKELVPNLELAKMFQGNDFGSRRGFIGCALSHVNLWKQLATSDQNYYTIFEDDITFTANFKEHYSKVQEFLKEGVANVVFLGYTSHSNSARNEIIENNPFPSLNISKYIGGTFGYYITKDAAKKLLAYIETNGIKHGIDYLMVRVPDIKFFSVQPHIVLSDWVRNDIIVDSDIQKDTSTIALSTVTHPEDWIFYPNVDSGDKDIKSIGRKGVSDLMLAAELTEGCVAFNTLGFLKSDVQWPLKSTPWLKEKDGIYIHRSAKKKDKIRVKMLCNWCSSEQLCKDWNTMSQGNYTWNNIEITWSDIDIDYWVIINKPPPNAHFVPEKTIVFQMEPWCGDESQTWGVKTWGAWAKPDPTKFLQVRSHEHYYNNAFWQLNMTYYQLKDKTPQKTMNNRISSICSSKYFDPGHKFRIDFLKFLDAKNDPSVQVDVWNTDNKHGFRSYKGPVFPHKDKELGIVPYKYYFMCENNAERNFITEKIWEPIITETLVFYWGCPNVKDYIDEWAYVQLDMSDFEGSFQLIKKAIAENWWEARLPFIRAAKAKILDYYQFFPTIERTISEDRNRYKQLFANIQNPKTACFIHSCHTDAGTDRLDLLFDTLEKQHMFKKLDIVVIQNCGLPLKEQKYKDRCPNLKIIQYSNQTNLFELPTLKLISYFSKQFPNVKLLYLHTKGISYPKSDPKYIHSTDWINMMLYFLVNNSYNCLTLLDTNDTVGCNYNKNPSPHFSGNFWWAKTNYLAQLSTNTLINKMDAEWWVHTGNPTYKSLHNSNINHFNESYSIDKYGIYFLRPYYFDKKSGLCNQLFTFITGLILAIQQNKKIIVCDKFLREINSESFIPVSEIFDLDALNESLKIYGITIIEKTNETNNFDTPNGWINTYDDKLFNKLLKTLVFSKNIQKKANDFIDSLNSLDNINVIHLRNEDDMIIHFSTFFNKSHESVKCSINNMYINSIKETISKSDTTIILTYSLDNPVLDFLNDNNYKYYINKKDPAIGREINAAIDLCASKICNKLFIGLWNNNILCGSSFSYTIFQRLSESVSSNLLTFNPYENLYSEYDFYPCLDSPSYDVKQVTNLDISNIYNEAIKTPGCVAFNTRGFIKTYVSYPLVPSKYFKERDGIFIRKDAYKCSKIQSNIKLNGRWSYEYPEQCMSCKLLKGDEKVLELGSNIGRNSLVIAAILKDQSQFVTMECDPESVKKVSEHRDINSMSFHIEPSALSKKPLIQKEWMTKPSELVEPGWTRVNTITYEELVAKYKIQFDTLIADCEGALYYILQDMPEVLSGMNLIIMENDYHDISHKQTVDRILREAGFERIYKEAGGWGPCYNFFYEAWKRM